MKICTVIGARPQFIKAAAFSRALGESHEEIIIHTGQHFDKNMSNIFFEELEIPEPKYNLGISGGTHGKMTGEMLIKIEEVLIKEEPDMLVLYGDTNSTLAGALAACKLRIPIAHIEAGPRIGIKTNPEENNRIVTDHLSTYLFCPDSYSVDNLKKEGIVDNVYNVGDIMLDTFNFAKSKVDIAPILNKYRECENGYILMTMHRAENVDSKERLIEILDFLKKIKKTILLPIHPRTKFNLEKFDLMQEVESIKNLILIEPVGYFEMVALMDNCDLVLTDSGGLSKESYFAKVKCIFMLEAEVWPDLKRIGWISTLSTKDKKITDNLVELCNSSKKVSVDEDTNFYGTGNAANEIVNIISK